MVAKRTRISSSWSSPLRICILLLPTFRLSYKKIHVMRGHQRGSTSLAEPLLDACNLADATSPPSPHTLVPVDQHLRFQRAGSYYQALSGSLQCLIELGSCVAQTNRLWISRSGLPQRFRTRFLLLLLARSCALARECLRYGVLSSCGINDEEDSLNWCS